MAAANNVHIHTSEKHSVKAGVWTALLRSVDRMLINPGIQFIKHQHGMRSNRERSLIVSPGHGDTGHRPFRHLKT